MHLRQNTMLRLGVPGHGLQRYHHSTAQQLAPPMILVEYRNKNKTMSGHLGKLGQDMFVNDYRALNLCVDKRSCKTSP